MSTLLTIIAVLTLLITVPVTTNASTTIIQGYYPDGPYTEPPTLDNDAESQRPYVCNQDDTASIIACRDEVTLQTVCNNDPSLDGCEAYRDQTQTQPQVSPETIQPNNATPEDAGVPLDTEDTVNIPSVWEEELP